MGSRLAGVNMLEEGVIDTLGPHQRTGLYRPSVWLGTSIACKDDLKNIDELRKCRELAPVLFLSAEPLLQDLGDIDLTGIDWLICGGESGPNARPMHPDWARSLRDQCQAAGVPFFFKQWGGFRPYGESSGWNMSGVDTTGRVFVGLDGAIWNDPDYETRHPLLRVGKVAAGRLLDGREWSEFPKVSV